MARKIINRVSPGTADIFGADDLNYVNKLLTGIDQSGSDPVDINTTWKFRTSKLQLANTANTFKYTVVPSAIGDNYTITLPLLTGNDTLVVTGAGMTANQTLTKKTMDFNSNTFLNFPSAGIQLPDVMRYGGYYGGDFDSFEGIYQGLSRGTITGTTVAESRTGFLTASEGRYMRYIINAGGSGGASNNTGVAFGSEGAGGGVMRSIPFRFKCKFRVNQSTSERFFCGFRDYTSGPGGSDTPLTNDNGFAVFYSTAVGSNYLLEHNDGGSAAGRDTIAAKDAGTHTVEIIGDSTNMRYSWDGGSFVNVTSDIPGLTTVLYPAVWLQVTSTAEKSMDVWYWYIETSG